MKKNIIIVIVSLFMIFFVAVTWLPISYIIITSLRSDNAFGSRELWISWENISWVSYKRLFSQTDFLLWLRNSFFLSLGSALVGVLLASTAGYVLARYRFAAKKTVLISLISTQMFPATMILLPLFIILAKLKLVDSLVGLFILYASSALPFCIWQLKSYYETIPVELEEAARLDGCNEWQVFWRITLPLAAPGIAVTALFSFMSAWSEYPLASVILQNPQLYTAPLGLKSFQASLATEWGLYAAGAILVSIPAVVVFMFLSRYLISGLSLGGVKS
ncbi:MAG: ABC transporter permease subunit [Pseudobdellovibrionaceae bacterium]|nr:ABC transporter permease subunit [Pseudobdellovibrionaceae bacterium]